MQTLYITSSACISPQKTFLTLDFFEQPEIYNNSSLRCIEPEFKNYINPVQIRRMSRALKIGFATAMQCLNTNENKQIDAIIIGTGKGCMSDTEAFLHSIKTYQETALNATHFIHSTYNQLNGMIALSQKINSYNVTYVHRGFSFEHTLLDAALHFAEGDAQQILVGSFDEMTDEHFLVKKHWNYWKEEEIQNVELLNSKTPGTIAGEGSAFFSISNSKPHNNAISIKHVATLYKPSFEDIEYELFHLLESNEISINDIDILMLGENGDANQPGHYEKLKSKFEATPEIYFKHLCGEYDTAMSFGCWLATQILEHQKVPKFLFKSEPNFLNNKQIRYILIYNNYFELNQSLILLER